MTTMHTVNILPIKPERTGKIILTEYTCPSTGEIKILKDSFGNKRSVAITSEGIMINLNNHNDELIYEFAKEHPLFVKAARPLLRIVNRQAEAKEELSHTELKVEALVQAQKLLGDKLVDFARVLGLNTTNVDLDLIKRDVYEYAENDSAKFISMLTDPDRKILELMYKGKEKGVFNHHNGVWKYNKSVIGTTLDQAIMWFKNNENQDLLPGIRKQIKSA